MRDEVVGSRYAISDKGWIDQEPFHYWLRDHFLANAVAARPLLLLLDGHSSHYEPATINLAKESDIVLFCLPLHTTHECQPLDCSLFGPLKTHWQQACHDFYCGNPGKVISKLNFCCVFREAWLKAVTPATISSGFRKAGVFPFNPQAVPLPQSQSRGTDPVMPTTAETICQSCNSSGESSSIVSKFLPSLPSSSKAGNGQKKKTGVQVLTSLQFMA